MPRARIEPSKDPQQIIELLEDRLYVHNAAAISRHDGELFAFTVRDDDGHVIAGVAGWTWAGVAEITQLWVDASARKQGLGAALLQAAENAAKDHGCGTLLVRSHGFQAPHFYQRHGFHVEHVLRDFPAGHDYHILLKRITCTDHPSKAATELAPQ